MKQSEVKIQISAIVGIYYEHLEITRTLNY